MIISMLCKLVKRKGRKLALPLLLTCSTLAWFCLLKLSRPSQENLDATPPFGLEVTSDTDAYINTTFSLTRSDLNLDAPAEPFDLSIGPADHPPTAGETESLVTVAIVSVESSSIDTLSETLMSFLPLSSRIQEIVLVCPAQAIHAVRDILRDVLTDEEDMHIDTSITTWINGLEEGSAILYAARQVVADRLIIFDSDSLKELTFETLGMLSSPLLTPLPVGPRGFEINGQNIVCVQASEDPKAAAFLVPPFSVEPTLIPPHDVSPTPVYDVWRSLGEHISRARFERVGGIVVSRDSSGDTWCRSQGEQPAPQSRLPEMERSAFAVAATQPEENILPSDSLACKSESPIFVVLFGSETNFHQFSPALCRMQNKGRILRSFLVLPPELALNVSVRLLPLPRCTIKATSVPGHVNLLDQEMQINSSPCPPTAIIISGLEPTVSEALFRNLSQKHASAALIQIPDGDLPYCDWFGTLSVDAWRNWAKPQLEISVITDDRPKSLGRLLTSLSAAHFFGDHVALRINIEQTAGPRTLQLINEFHWPHGPVFIHRRIIHGGLLPAVVESWYPQSNHSYGLILEDDIEVSPLFYAWIKMSLLQYRYGRPENPSAQLFGISLYQQKILELRPEGRHRFDARTVLASASADHVDTPYLSQIPCSWGAVYFPEHWREFHDYLAARLSGTLLPVSGIIAPGVRSNKWTRSWKKYFIELAFLRGYVMLYPNFRDYRSLSTNHLEVGSHVKEMTPEAYDLKKKLYQLPLLRPTPVLDLGSDVPLFETGLLDLPEGRMPEWDTLPVLDLLGLLTAGIDLQERGRARGQELFRCGNAAHASHFLRSLVCPDGAPVERSSRGSTPRI